MTLIFRPPKCTHLDRDIQIVRSFTQTFFPPYVSVFRHVYSIPKCPPELMSYIDSRLKCSNNSKIVSIPPWFPSLHQRTPRAETSLKQRREATIKANVSIIMLIQAFMIKIYSNDAALSFIPFHISSKTFDVNILHLSTSNSSWNRSCPHASHNTHYTFNRACTLAIGESS